MARAYKANRARGSRASTYKRTVVSGFVIPKIPRIGGEEAYLKEFIELNKNALNMQYKKELEKFEKIGAGDQFKAANPNLFSYVKKIVKIPGQRITKKRLVEVVQGRLAPISERQYLHLLNLIKANQDFYQELLAEITPNETDISLNRLSYDGDSVFTYRAVNGKILKFAFEDYSESYIVWLQRGDAAL